ncbi:UDP-3-O-(3-hydroxymyristoyl)glucosamine N-acyltransferase [Legionella dresdenensis]|uniref:UDP-3-O-(3-hydroxymyristoyl)glucosamine N-acyltransferase n=1 Tax=Legionella dresdenensis TaxID=450200 RepID=A0ABV8CI13_9GAMM
MGNIKTVAELANVLNGSVHGNHGQAIQGFASLKRANQNQLTCYDGNSPLDWLTQTQAGAVLTLSQFLEHCSTNAIVVDNLQPAVARALSLFSMADDHTLTGTIHPTAVIDGSVTIADNVSIGANSVIGADVILAENVKIGPNCSIAPDCYIGERTVVKANTVIGRYCHIGSDCLIESGVIVGTQPFNGCKIQGQWQAGLNSGGVFIESAVTIGANTVIAAGTYNDTCIGQGTWIDNLVHIAHDVIIGAHTAIAGCAVLGAWVQTGKHCIIGGASTLAANVRLGDDIVITGMSSVNKSLAKPGIYSSGTMVSEHNQWRRNVARFRRLDDYINRFVRLEKDWLAKSNYQD